MGVIDAQADVLERFAAADAALRQVHGELSALALARADAEGAAGSLSAAADAVAQFAQQAQGATLSAVDVQETVRAALEGIRSVSSSLDVPTLLNEVRLIRQEFREVREALASVADRVQVTDEHIAALHGLVERTAVSTAALSTRMDVMGANLARQVEVSARMNTAVDSGRSEARVVAADSSQALQNVADANSAATQELRFLLSDVESRLNVAIASVESDTGGQIDGIVQALPRRYQRKLGL